MSLFKKYAWYGSAVVASALLAVALLLAGPADKTSAAAPVLTTDPAFSVNLSTNAATGINTTTAQTANFLYTAAGAEFTVANNAVLTAPAGWVFDTTATIVATCAGGTFSCTATPTSVTTTAVTIDVTTVSAATNTLTITGVKVKPETVLSATANIKMDLNGVPGDTGGDDLAAGGSITAVVDTGNYVTAGSGVGASSTATPTGSTLLMVTAQGVGLTSATFQTSAGTFAANGTASLFCGDGVTSCDTTVTANDRIPVQLSLPSSGTVTVTVTPSGVGTASTITLTLSAAQVLTSIQITPTTALATAAAGGNVDITAQLLDQNGAAFTTATTVTASTDRGVISSDGTTCDTSADDTQDVGSDASCTYPSTGAAAVLELFGSDSPGTAVVTITATSGGVTVSNTKNVTLTGGVVSSLTITTAQGVAATTGTVTARSIMRGVDSTGDTDEIIVIVKALDANGNSIVPAAPAVTITITDAAGANAANFFTAGTAENATLSVNAGTAGTGGVSLSGARCIDNIEANALLPTTNLQAAAMCVIDVDVTTAIPNGVYTITATQGSGTTLKTATATFSVAGATDSVSVALGASTVEVGGSTTATATVLDADGNPVTDGTTVTFSVSSGLAQTSPTTGGTGNTANTVGGTATINLLGLAQGSGQVFAIVGTKSGSATLTVGAATPPPPPPGTEGTFDRSIPNVGVNTAVWNGGTVADLSAATAAAGGISVTVFIGGEATVLIPGAPAFVNAAFNAAFPTGDVPSGTIVLVVR